MPSTREWNTLEWPEISLSVGPHIRVPLEEPLHSQLTALAQEIRRRTPVPNHQTVYPQHLVRMLVMLLAQNPSLLDDVTDRQQLQHLANYRVLRFSMK